MYQYHIGMRMVIPVNQRPGNLARYDLATWWLQHSYAAATWRRRPDKIGLNRNFFFLETNNNRDRSDYGEGYLLAK